MAKAPTAAQFRSKAEAMFRAANPAAADLVVAWEWTSRLFPLAAGAGRGRTGRFRATAPGHRTRTLLASWTEGLGWHVG